MSSDKESKEIIEKPSKSEIVMKAREYTQPPEKKRVPGENEKKCTYLRHIMPLKDFSKHAEGTKRGGQYFNICNSCRELAKEERKKNKVIHDKARQNWLKNNPNYHKVYYQLNKDRMCKQAIDNYNKRRDEKEKYKDMVEAQDIADQLISVN
jgi:hypothetical protein